LLSGQSERIPPHRMQDIKSPHAFVAGHDIRRSIAFKMADVEARAGWIGKHVEAVEFWLGPVVSDTEGPVLLPIGLPLYFESVMIVGLAHTDAESLLSRKMRIDSNIDQWEQQESMKGEAHTTQARFIWFIWFVLFI
jgi:hypothetical protein